VSSTNYSLDAEAQDVEVHLSCLDQKQSCVNCINYKTCLFFVFLEKSFEFKFGGDDFVETQVFMKQKKNTIHIFFSAKTHA